MRQGHLRSLAVKEEDSVYRLYYDFRPARRKARRPPDPRHQPRRKGGLPLRHGTARPRHGTSGAAPRRREAGSAAMEFMKSTCEDAYDRLIYPSLEREARAKTHRARLRGAIKNFGLNLKPLLMRPPVKGKVTMGLDPGYAHGARSPSSTAPARCSTPRSCTRPSAPVKGRSHTHTLRSHPQARH